MVISLRLKKIHVNGIRIIGIVGFAVIFLVFLTIPNIGNTNVFKSVDIVPQSAEDIINEAKGIGQYSVVDTDELFTESNDSILQQFLDSQNIDSPLSTEKFGIEIQTALIDSFGNKSLNSTIFGVSQLSVLDEQGRILDLGSMQTSFLGLTKNPEKSVNIWGTVKFYLDDDLIATKKIWASSSNQQKTPLFIVSNLSIVESNIDHARISEIENQISVLRNEIISLGEQSCVNCNGRDTEIRIRDDKIDSLNKELILLESKIDEKLPSSPSFSDRKTNFTFTLSDEGRNWANDSVHYYRVVLTEVNANIDSDNDFKKFTWSGEYIAYELKVTVDEAKIVRFDVTTGKPISVLKSDGTFSVNSGIRAYYQLYAGGIAEELITSTNPPLPVSFQVFLKDTNKLLGVIDNTSFNLNRVEQTNCNNYSCYVYVSVNPVWKNPIISDIPRNTDLLIKTSDGKSIQYKTPLSQHNMFVSCENYDNPKCTSNFGYSK